jgi:hypothetical protein
MRHFPFLSIVPAAGLVMAALATPAPAQTPDSVVPTISARQFKGGSAKVIVKGSFQIDQVVAINTVASISDGEMTWLQFGASGSAQPNALITYGQDIGEGVGINVGKGKLTVTAGSDPCVGEVTITATLMSGHYTCAGVTSYDAATGRMGTVDIEITFTAQS